jgi:hypothetical protein
LIEIPPTRASSRQQEHVDSDDPERYHRASRTPLNDDVRTSLLRCVELADTAAALPRPSDAEDAEQLLAAVETAHLAFVRLMGQVTKTDFAILGEDLARIADRILQASRELVIATRFHTAV